ncbi:MAG: MFS transporter [Planctomycetota bacterium]
MDHPPTDRRAGFASRRALWSWVTYDWGSNAFATVIQTFVFATFFTRAVAPDPATGQSWWSWAMAIAAVTIAILAPITGAIADATHRRKPWIAAGTGLCVIATACMWLIRPDSDWVIAALAFGAIGTLGSELALVPYNAMLADLVPRRRLGSWSGYGWGAGYLGGLACLIIVLLLFARPGSPVRTWLGDDEAINLRVAFVFCAVWYAGFSLPLFLFTPEQAPAACDATRQKRENPFTRLLRGLRGMRRRPDVLRFLIARLLYIDGMATLFQLGGVYAAGVFAMDASRVLYFGITLTAAAGIGAIAFSRVDDHIGGRRTVLLGLVALCVGCLVALLAPNEPWLWAGAVIIGTFVGPVQSGSRSLMARMAGEEERGELFGLFAFSGKVMSFLGPASVGLVTWLSGSQRWGMASVLVFLVGGAVVLLTVREQDHSEG